GKEARRLEAVRLRESGLTQQEIANRLGVSQKTISNDLK
ncbi:helix-turn-helix domain-containing protein, partial [Salmonella sp. SAL4444]